MGARIAHRRQNKEKKEMHGSWERQERAGEKTWKLTKGEKNAETDGSKDKQGEEVVGNLNLKAVISLSGLINKHRVDVLSLLICISQN